MNDEGQLCEVFEDALSFIITFAMKISLRCLVKVLLEQKEVYESVCMYK